MIYICVYIIFEWVLDDELEAPDAAPQSPGQAPPSPDYVSGPEHPPSPDYVHGLEELEHTPLSPVYVPELEYPEYFVPSNDEASIEDQPIPADASPTALSSGYVVDSDLEEDDKEDQEEQEAPEKDEDGEEEHLALANSTALSIDDSVPSAEDTEAFKTDEFMAAPAPPSPPPSPLTSLSSPLAQISSPALPLPSPTHTSPTYAKAPLGYKAVRIRLRAALPPLLLPSTTYKDDITDANMPFRKRAYFTAPTGKYKVRKSSMAAATRQLGLDVGTMDVTPRRPMSREVSYGITDVWDDMVEDMEERAPTIEDLSQRVTDLATTLAWDTHEIYVRLEDAQDDRDLQRGRVNMLFRDRRFHRHTFVLLDSEARHAREAWSHSMNYIKATQLTTAFGRIQTLEAREPERARDPEPQDGPANAGSSC
nr:hypothetical protein [Tanacetum cinerariifolium]